MNFAALIDPDTLQPSDEVAKQTACGFEYRVLEVTRHYIVVSIKQGTSLYAWKLATLRHDGTDVCSNQQVLVSNAKVLKVRPYTEQELAAMPNLHRKVGNHWCRVAKFVDTIDTEFCTDPSDPKTHFLNRVACYDD